MYSYKSTLVFIAFESESIWFLVKLDHRSRRKENQETDMYYLEKTEYLNLESILSSQVRLPVDQI